MVRNWLESGQVRAREHYTEFGKSMKNLVLEVGVEPTRGGSPTGF